MDRSHAALRILLKGYELFIADIALLNRLVHGLRHNPIDGIGYPGYSQALQQGPQLRCGIENDKQHQRDEKQQ